MTNSSTTKTLSLRYALNRIRQLLWTQGLNLFRILTIAAKAAKLKEMRESTSNFEAASSAEVDRLAVLKKERIESRVEHVEKRRSDLNLIEDCQRADVNNIRKKLGMFQESNKIKTSIQESKIVLENGIDKFVMPNIDEIDFGYDIEEDDA